MNVTFLALTCLSVSADCFFIGLSISIKNTKKLPATLIVTSVVFALCLTGALLGKIFGEFLKNYAQLLSGIILIAVGISGLIDKGEVKHTNNVKQLIFVGASVGLDGAVGSFSLTAIGYSGIFVAFSITLIHFVFLILAFLLGKKLSKKIKAESKLPPLTLIALGIYKLLT